MRTLNGHVWVNPNLATTSLARRLSGDIFIEKLSYYPPYGVRFLQSLTGSKMTIPGGFITEMPLNLIGDDVITGEGA